MSNRYRDVAARGTQRRRNPSAARPAFLDLARNRIAYLRELKELVPLPGLGRSRSLLSQRDSAFQPEIFLEHAASTIPRREGT
jgi:hypothetical protein